MAENSQDDPRPPGWSSYHHNNTDMIQMASYYNSGSSSNGSLMFCDSSNSNNGTSCSSIVTVTGGSNGGGGSVGGPLLLDTVPGLKHDAGLAVEWTDDEQFKLEEGLLKYKDEPSIMKYIKISAMLRDKTVRDVALRCKWMTRKRRKQDDSPLGRKGNYRKDKLGESSSKANLPSASIPTSVGYSYPMNPADQSQRVKSLSSKAKHLLDQNMQAFTQINNNLSSFMKLQDNINLFCRARDNINNVSATQEVVHFQLQDNINLFCRARDNINNVSAILNDLRRVSVKIKPLQDLPISIDQNLANSILPHATP